MFSKETLRDADEGCLPAEDAEPRKTTEVRAQPPREGDCSRQRIDLKSPMSAKKQDGGAIIAAAPGMRRRRARQERVALSTS